MTVWEHMEEEWDAGDLISLMTIMGMVAGLACEGGMVGGWEDEGEEVDCSVFI
jgi:hypothetical protein